MQTDSGGVPTPLDASLHGSPRKLLTQLSVPDSKDVRIMLTRLGYVEEEKPLVPGIVVRAASIEKLTKMVVECFDSSGALSDTKQELPRVFFLMHQWFMESQDLAQLFVNLYRDNDIKHPCNVLGCQHTLASLQCERTQYKLQVCQVVRYWIRQFPVYFDLDRQLSEAVHKLQGIIRQESVEDETQEMAELVDISKVPSYDWMRNMSVRNPSIVKHASATGRVSLVFNNLQASELADQLTFMEYKAFRRITFGDFKSYAQNASLKDNPKLERSVALFNGLSQWIQCMVLSKTTPKQRADVIVKFVDVAKRLNELQNFNTLMAVVGGLSHSSLARLGKTNTCIPAETQKMLMDFTEMLSSSTNFSNYRRVLQQAEGFKIPILGVHLKDMILLNTALPDLIEDHLVNFRKMVQLSLIFSELMQVESSTLPVEANMDLVNTIRLSLDLHYTEDDIYELSLAREPRNSLSSPSTPTKPVVFAEWVAGVSPPDQKTINKHVHDMVEAVFKNYDHDRDGFISHVEFDAIAGNFPFIDSFAVLDADQDGMISKGEMKAYFIRANCHALRKCFKHNFHEITYFKPTFCIHCTGLLWGLIKQGWKCKDCGINAHKHCKDLVVMECRSKAHAGCHGRTSMNGGHRDVTLSSKRKMSQRQKRARSSRATQTLKSSLVSTKSSGSKSDPDLDNPDTADDSNGSFNKSDGSINKSDEDDREPTKAGLAEGEFYEEKNTLYDRLVEAEETRDKLLVENKNLSTKLDIQNSQITTLKTHIGAIRQHTVTFILDQMDTLRMQRDTEV